MGKKRFQCGNLQKKKLRENKKMEQYLQTKNGMLLNTHMHTHTRAQMQTHTYTPSYEK